ncbi:diacylglycerol kinase zeta isoform X2 [Chelonus insularis]|uniref:diacylglycerol kinase zeta isoform X2 n=1 Tax=Chelonus insularis TaxID=460826 RepID=UPI00158E5EAE|nr:diacylglycerol kinase zeta isoform X2 [Chelonus insularis]
MQKLRSTFKRSRTPTGTEMKSQLSLEVPKQIRSASFDEIQLEVKRQTDETTKYQDLMLMKANITPSSSPSSTRADAKKSSTLRVPLLQSSQKSQSFSTYEKASLLSSTSSRLSISSSGSHKNDSVLQQQDYCHHCVCVRESKQLLSRKKRTKTEQEISASSNAGLTVKINDDNEYDDANDDDEDDDDFSTDSDDSIDDYDINDCQNVIDSKTADCIETQGDNNQVDEEERVREGSPEIRVTLINFDRQVSEFYGSDVGSVDGGGSSDDSQIKVEFIPAERSRRLSRQEALTSFPINLPSITGVTDTDDQSLENITTDGTDRGNDGDEEEDDEDDDEDDENDSDKLNKKKFIVRDIFLTVPELKRDRAASVDSCFDNNNKISQNDGSNYLTVPQQGARSKSVDIVLPTEQQTHYTALLPKKDGVRGGKGPDTSNRQLRSTPDWGPDAINGEHLWNPTATSGDFCYVNDCSKHGPRLKCAACHVVAHVVCAPELAFNCKPTFRDVGVRQYREQSSTHHHHWVHRRSQKGKCANCAKAFQSKLSFSSKEIVAVSCSWCKSAYHNKESCFNVQKVEEDCELGTHNTIIVPPSWIIKLPRKGDFKSSLRKSPRKKKGASQRKSKDTLEPEANKSDKADDKEKLWVVKSVPSLTIKPVIVFINPKSGGNQGAKLLQKFQWLLNPRQVFDLTQGGPRMGLELFQKVPNLRVLACGGDGTVGWVLSILDQIGVSPSPAVGVLPLGTGNDLARALGWGGGYTDEPIGKILLNIGDSDTTLLDRWQVTVERNPDANNDDDSGKGKENLPLNVVNNYFSLGVDAHIALEFHEAREAHPEKFNSRLRNKMFYGQMGGKDLVRRKWKDLSEFVTLECDGQDLTPKLKEHRVHAIVFLNIPSYGGGTRPWGSISGGKEPSTEDGLLEVVGLTTYQLPLLQAGGHGTCITQCSRARLVTTRTIPMQVDGEACRVLPSIIELQLLNQATMLAKRRHSNKPQQNVENRLESLKLPIMGIKMIDYKAYHSDKDRLKKAAVSWSDKPLDLEVTMDLESLRKMLAKDYPMDNCCFLDSCTAERFFRIDRAQEQLHYVTDVASEAIYILEEESTSQNVEPDIGKIPEPDANVPSPSEETSISNKPPTSKESKDQGVVEHSNEEKMKERLSTEQQEENKITTAKNIVNEKNTSEKIVRKKSLLKQISFTERSHREPHSAFISPQERLFSLSSEVQTFGSGLLEKTSDGILRAAKGDDLKSLKELHDRGYSLLSIDANGQTALHLAARHGFKDIVRYLIACAPPTLLNMVDNDKGQTALHKAAQTKRRSICCMLVAGGATLTVRDRHGNTPRQLALNAEDRDLAAYLHSQEQFQLVTEDMQNRS